MIYAVTLNPCLDKTLTVPDWKPGNSVRGRAVSSVVGGKGNNVARALRRFGREVRPVTFLGGAVGRRCEAMLRDDDGLSPVVIYTESETRVILTVRTEGTDAQTAFFDPDPAILAEEAEQLFERVSAAIADPGLEALTLSGSSPSEATHHLYSELIGVARRAGVPVFLDTYGPALRGIAEHWPTAIQVNRKEAGIFLNNAEPNEADCFGLIDEWNRRGVESAMITNGPDPALVSIRGAHYRVAPPRVEAVNPVGSGDSLLAGLVHGWLTGLDAEGLIRLAVGAGVANALVWDAGAIDLDEARRQGDLARIEPR